MSNFKTDTKKNFQLVFSYLSRIDDELMEIRGDKRNKKGIEK